MAAVPPLDPMTPRVVRVRRRRRDLKDTVTLELEPDGDGGDGGAFPFAPGQFNMLTAFGVGESAISVSGDPAARTGFVHTIRAVGPVSRALAALRPGDSLGLRGPFGTSWPVEAARGGDVIVVAGGIGLAPLRPALYRLLAERDRYGRIVLLYGARSPADILFRSEIESWRRRLDLSVEVTVDHAGEDWRGHVGVVTTLLPRVAFDAGNAVALLCGPEVMMRFAAALRDAGLSDEAIFVSMERNMKCAVGLCGHCQFGPVFVCRDGPVFRHDKVAHLIAVKEL
jgi:NAD(P)H-flavin reductase